MKKRKKMNYLLHGATNCGSSNYGDYIYGEMIYDYLKKRTNNNVIYFQPSFFFKRYLKNYDENKKFSIINSNLIVYIPGGYFGEGPNARIKDNIIQFIRFMPVGLIGSFLGKKIVIIGVGAGPLNNFFMKKGVKIICDHSEFITLRDKKSYECIKNLSNNKNIYEAGDLILTYNPKLLKKDSPQIKIIKESSRNKKIFLIHFNHDLDAMKKFAQVVNKISENINDYYFVVSSDSILKDEDKNIKEFKEIAKFDFFHFKYENPHELSTLISITSIVLTCKLHVGVVSCLLNKSVFVAACHFDKTKRFYEQINNADRCVELGSSSVEDIYKMIISKRNINVTIPNKEISKAKISWQHFSKYLEDISNE